MSLTKATQNVIDVNICTTDTTQVITGGKTFSQLINGSVAGTSSSLSSTKTIQIAGDIVANPVVFNGSSDISLISSFSSGANIPSPNIINSLITNPTITGGSISSSSISGATINSPVFSGTATGSLVVTGGVTANVTGNLTGSLTSGGSINSQPVQSASGTAINFTGIPSWVKRIIILFDNLSTSGSSNILIQIGSSSYLTTGYSSWAGYGTTITNQTTGFGLTYTNGASYSHYGRAVIELISANRWIFNSSIIHTAYQALETASGSVIITSSLDRVRITTVNGTDTFDNGIANILYEG